MIQAIYITIAIFTSFWALTGWFGFCDRTLKGQIGFIFGLGLPIALFIGLMTLIYSIQ